MDSAHQNENQVGRKSICTLIRAKFSDFPPTARLEAKAVVSIQ